MYTKPAPRTDQQSLFFDLESQLNQKHPLYLLANKIDWEVFEEAFKGLYCANNGRPAKPIRRMVGLLILKHVRNVSDESVVEQWPAVHPPLHRQTAVRLHQGRPLHRPPRPPAVVPVQPAHAKTPA